MRERYFKDDGEVLYLDSGNEEAVKSAQRFLNENGYTDGYGRKLAEDGIFGKNTYNAVIKYQQDNNLQVDGKIGDETWSSMWNKEAEKYNNMKYDIPKAEDPKKYEEPEVAEHTTAGSSKKKRGIGLIAPFFYYHFNAAPSAESEAMKAELERQKRDEEYIKNNGWNAWHTSGMNQ